MKCRTIQKKLSAYQDGELKPREEKELRRHLQDCHSCKEAYENLERVWRAIGGLEEIRPDPWLYRRLAGRIHERKHGGLAALRRVLQLAGGQAAASIFLIAGLAAGAYLGRNLVEHDLLHFKSTPVADSRSAFLTSMKVFDPAPPGTLAEGYLRMASHEENRSR
jgi:anti-sigma factor RsiW